MKLSLLHEDTWECSKNTLPEKSSSYSDGDGSNDSMITKSLILYIQVLFFLIAMIIYITLCIFNEGLGSIVQ